MQNANRRTVTQASRTIELKGTSDMGRLADVLSQEEISTLIKAEQAMRQIRVRSRLSGCVPDAFWAAYETANELRHTALKRMVDHYAYTDTDADARS